MEHRFASWTSWKVASVCGVSSCVILLLLASMQPISAANEAPDQSQPQPQPAQQPAGRSTAPTLDRQVDTPNSAPVPASSPKVPSASNDSPAQNRARAEQQQQRKLDDKSSKQQQRKSLQNNQDKYQLKGAHSQPAPDASSPASGEPIDRDSAASKEQQLKSGSADKDAAADKSGSQKKSSGSANGNNRSSVFRSHGSSSTTGGGGGGAFAVFRRMLPSFMSAAPMAVAALTSVAAADKHQVSHSRSAQANGGETLLTKASGRLVNLLSSKKSAAPETPFFIAKPAIDRQSGFASSLLSNPLGLGLLFSAPLIPSLLLTPLAIAGLSPAMSAINNFFGDDDEPATASSTPGPLSSVLGGSSALSSLLQASGGSSSASSPSLAVQALHSIIGQPSSTEKPLFNPGMFASRGIQNAMSSAVSQASANLGSSSGGSQASASNSAGPFRSLLGGGGSLMQTAASMISPSFAAPPPASGSSAATGGAAAAAADAAEADEPSFIQMALDKVANYMSAERDLSQAAGSGKPGPAGLAAFSPFQLSSLLAASPLAAAFAPAGSSLSGSGSSVSPATGGSQPSQQRAGFFSTLKNVYELFSSSFLRRQEEDNSSGCHERLICEIHQKAMNSKLFKRSLQTELKELTTLDRMLLDQIKSGSLEARVDPSAKAFLTDFLKASNDFKNGQEMVDCSKLYPKCSRSMLFSVAKAQFNEATGGNTNVAEGKFASLIKKMKFKPAHHRKSKKPIKAASVPAMNLLSRPIVAGPSSYSPGPVDFMQEQASMQQHQVISSPLSPDNLKMVQQLLMMSAHQQPQYARQAVVQYPNFAPYTSVSNQPLPATIQGFYPAQPQDSMGLMYSNPTESPFFGGFPAAHDMQSVMQPHQAQMSRQAQPIHQQATGLNDYQFTQQQQASSTSLAPEQPQQVQQQQMPQQQMPQQQQLVATGSADKALNQQVAGQQTKLANAA